MFFFFVGGLEQQVGRVLKENAGRCIRCGSNADLVEYEKVLKLFFVPVWRWPGKEAAFYCRDCSLLFPRPLPPSPSSAADDGREGFLDEDARGPPVADALRCYSCDRVVEPNFRFCPFCGAAL